MTIFFKVKTDSSSSSSKSSNKTLEKRISYFKSVNQHIQSLHKHDPYNCFKFNNDIIAIGNDNDKNHIILDKKIGTKSAYGSVFISHFRQPNGKILTFTTKVVDSSKNYNNIEANVLEFLTELNVKYKICPNFPICYGVLRCNNFFQEQDKIKLNDKLNYKKLLFTFNELADNDLFHLFDTKQYTSKIVLNALSQIFMSIMFFHKHIQAYHTDCHAGNFLYHKIKPGGYFHYKINGNDYYIENIGYLWVIWDFGLIVPFKKIKYPIEEDFIYNKKYPINYDYLYILKKGLNHFNVINTRYIYNSLIKYTHVYDLTKMPQLVEEVLALLVKYSDGCFLTSLPSRNSKIINRVAYQY